MEAWRRLWAHLSPQQPLRCSVAPAGARDGGGPVAEPLQEVGEGFPSKTSARVLSCLARETLYAFLFSAAKWK